MRGPSLFSLVALVAMLIPHTVYGQPPGTKASGGTKPEPHQFDPNFSAMVLKALDVALEINAAGGQRKWENMRIDKQFGEFLDTLNGVPVQTRTVDNTETAKRELTYTLTSPLFTVGGTATVGLGHGFFAGGGGSLYVGTLELGVVDSQQARVTYDGSTAPIGYVFNTELGWVQESNTNFPTIVIRGRHEYINLDADQQTRTPAQTVTGGSITRASYRMFHNEHRTSAMAEMLSSYKSVARVRPRASVGYFTLNTRLDSLVSIDYAQTLAGLSSEFTGETELSKDGWYGTVGASFAITHGFNATADYSFGAEKGFTFGGTYTFSVRQ